MKKYFIFLTFLPLLFFFASCIQQEVEEHEFTVQADGSIFERSEITGLSSDCDSTNAALKDFQGLIEKYEPPITSKIRDKNVKGRFILRKELLQRSGKLNALEEAIYPAGLKTECISRTISNGFAWLPVSTNNFEIETNGELVSSPDNKNIFIKWRTNSPVFWYKKTRISKKGIDFLGFYEQYLEDGNK